MGKKISLGYQARAQFVPYHARKQRWACIVAHRRAGKTVACIMDLIDAALRCQKPEGRFAYVAPTYGQAKDVVWSYLKGFTAELPRVEQRESDLSVILHNGARIRLYGADNYDRMRGLYFDSVVLDEFADMDPRTWTDVVRPALTDRQGSATFIGTPKGRNAFFDVWDKAQGDADWYTSRLRASETGILDAVELEGARSTLGREAYAREFECDFDAAVEGAYYADGLAQAEQEGRICRLAIDPLLPIRAIWDIGGTGSNADAVAVWIAQWVQREIRWIDYYEAVGQELSYHVAWLRAKGYESAECILPHDGRQHEKIYKITWESALRDAGFRTRVIPSPRGAAMMRIEAGRRLFPRMYFDIDRTKPGRAALAAYHEKRDEKRNIGLGPSHDWSSHGSDAFGTGCIAYGEPPARPMREPYSGRSESSGSWITA